MRENGASSICVISDLADGLYALRVAETILRLFVLGGIKSVSFGSSGASSSTCRFRKLYPFELAGRGESEHDRRMITIGLLFLRMLRDWFKPQQRREAEILILRHQLNVLQRHTLTVHNGPPSQSVQFFDHTGAHLRRIPCEATLAITTISERTGHWTKCRRRIVERFHKTLQELSICLVGG